MINHFVTEFGHRIEFIEGFYDFMHKRSSWILPDQHYDGALFGRAKRQPDWTAESFRKPFIKNYVAFSYLTSFLKRCGLLRKWPTALDIGGGYGMISALFRASGLARHVTNVDIMDFSEVTPEYQTFVARIGELAALDPKSLKKAQDTFDFFPTNASHSAFYGDFTEAAQVDEFLHTDILSVTGTYNIVTAICTIDLFDLDVILSKIRTLLADGGMFVCLEEYWWWIANSSAIFGHFPYAEQRLTSADLYRYVSEFHPEIMPSLDARLNYLFAGKRPTFSDWRAAAERHGLEIVGLDRIIPKQHHRIPFSLPETIKLPQFKLPEILRDIHCYQPAINADDLQTSISALAMVKK